MSRLGSAVSVFGGEAVSVFEKEEVGRRKQEHIVKATTIRKMNALCSNVSSFCGNCPLDLELKLFTAVRSVHFYTRMFVTVLLVLCSLLMSIPLIVTMQLTFEDADRICEERTRKLWKDYEYPDGEEWDLEDWENIHQLMPIHVFNCINLAVSLACFLVWLFMSPHDTELGRDLDRKCTSNVAPPTLFS